MDDDTPSVNPARNSERCKHCGASSGHERFCTPKMTVKDIEHWAGLACRRARYGDTFWLTAEEWLALAWAVRPARLEGARVFGRPVQVLTSELPAAGSSIPGDTQP